MLATQDARGYHTSFVHDAAGQQVAVVDALGALSTLLYDAAGLRVAVVDASGGYVTSLYDARGQLTATQDPLGAYTSFQYDEDGRVVVRLDARGQATTYSHDAAGRNTGQLYPDGKRVTHTFDAAGQQLTVQDWTGITSYAYDAAGRRTCVTQPSGRALTYAFDAAGNRVAMVDPDGGRTTYAFDAENRLVGIVNPFAETTTIAHDPLGRESVKTVGNGMEHRHTYDAAGREVERWCVKADGTPLAAYTATYDAAGKRTAVVELDGSRVTYAYDGAGRLVDEWRSGSDAYRVSYTYGAAGNRLTKVRDGIPYTYTYGAGSELSSVLMDTGVLATHTWDANGNRLLVEQATERTSYAWDEENRLTQVTHPDATRETFTYATDGLRRRKESGSEVREFVWDGQNVLLETDANQATQVHYTDFPGAWGGLVSGRRQGASSFYGFDLQGNTRILVSAAGAVQERYACTAFGERLSGGANRFQFGGEVGYQWEGWDRYYIRARVLDAVTGLWLSRDPAEFPPPRETEGGAAGWEVYAGSNPVANTDPSGRWWSKMCISSWPKMESHLRVLDCMGLQVYADEWRYAFRRGKVQCVRSQVGHGPWTEEAGWERYTRDLLIWDTFYDNDRKAWDMFMTEAIHWMTRFRRWDASCTSSDNSWAAAVDHRDEDYRFRLACMTDYMANVWSYYGPKPSVCRDPWWPHWLSTLLAALPDQCRRQTHGWPPAPLPQWCGPNPLWGASHCCSGYRYPWDAD